MSQPQIGLIWAEADGGVIGKDGVMPWHVPEDLAHFKQVTLDAAVIMGRKTWDSLPPRFRPLPGRSNIVITRQADWAADGVDVVHSLTDALAIVGEQPAWVIGGAQIYALARDVADRLEVTEIRAAFDGDTFAPAIDASWTASVVDPADGWHVSRTGLEYRFVRYERS
ncbi:dihydrofolate reductase [Glaciibacter psychrotolerans]|uniref:Dihydrofolate reductase n=1 Tax=Glaciibacter psychrotolerans TaxID=670054 RepID=A0A7Z0J7A2_9MICO|nr:dihydrofolate reductase [Leifsonia psychrotolerans]NYJ21397.1 dihydrofolate reductase [Leifsonia psychrotolerans]